MGAAFLAGLAIGFWENTEEIQHIWQIETYFHPTIKRENIDEGIKGWYRAIDAIEYWTKQ